MKRLHLSLFVVAIACLLVGCRKPVEVSFDNQSQTIAAEGGSYSVELKSNGDWSIDATAEWLTVSPTSGHGDATLTLEAQRNTTHETRSTEIKATTKDNTATLTVSQEFIPNVHPEEHYLTITPSEYEVGSQGGTTTIDIECDEEWMTDEGVNWVRFDRTEGNGYDQIVLTVLENTTFVSRMAEIKFVSPSNCMALLVVRQEAAIDPHYLEVSPRGISIGKEGGMGAFTVETDEEWQVTNDCDWLTLSTESGFGNGSFEVTAEPNEIFVARQARVKVVSRNLEKIVFVTQEPGDDPYMASIEPDTLHIDSPNGGRAELTITANCEWTIEAPSWITLMTTEGSHNATLEIMVGYNDMFVARTGVISVKLDGAVLASTVVVQEGRESILTVDVTDVTMPAQGGAQYFNVTSNQPWEIHLDAEWIQCTPSLGGEGTTNVMVKAVEWQGSEPREALIIIKGDFGAITTVWVHQNP